MPLHTLDRGVSRSVPVALTIAGSDPSGGAGLQADVKTFHQFGVFGMGVPTLLTVQNTCGVRGVRAIDSEFVRDQLACLHEDIPPDVAKAGALGEAANVLAVAEWANSSGTPVVLDPVMVTTHGERLTSDSALEILVERLLPLCLLVTPNLREAELLANMSISDVSGMQVAADRIARLGARNVLIKGGHLGGDPIDLLWLDGKVRKFSAPRIKTTSTHGTGCTLSAAIAALLALGRPLGDAVAEAKAFVTRAIETAPGLGHGKGPLNFHAATRDDPG